MRHLPWKSIVFTGDAISVACLLMLNALTWVTLALWGDWRAWTAGNKLLALGMIFATQGVIVYLLARSSVRQWRRLRLIRAQFAPQPASIAPISLPSDAALALRPGKTLLVERRLRLGPIWQTILLMPVGLFVVSLIAVNALDQFLRVPAPHPHQHSARIMLISLTILAPLIGCLLVYAQTVFTVLSQRRMRIQLDDAGITVRQSLHRSTCMGWDKLQAGLFIPVWIDQPLTGAIWIGDQEAGITFDTALVTPHLHRQRFTTVGDIDTYLAALQQLFVTVAARAKLTWHAPQQQAQQIAALLEKLARRRELAKADAEADAAIQASLAKAPAPLQPLAELVALASGFTLPLVMRPRFPWGIWLKNTLFLFVTLMALISCMIYARLIARYSTLQTAQVALIVFPAAVVVLFIFAARFGWEVARDRYPSVIADARGITLWKGTRNRRKLLYWDDITFWGCRISEDGNIAYTLASATAALAWLERAHGELAGTGDRQAAYRARYDELHALIARRTQLPLLLFPAEKSEIQTSAGMPNAQT